MRRGQAGPGVPGWTQITLGQALVGPWQYQTGRWAVPTRYIPPGTTPPHPPWYTPPHPPWTMYPPLACTRAPWDCTYDRFEATVGDPRGEIRTGTVRARSLLCRPLAATLRRLLSGPSLAPALTQFY